MMIKEKHKHVASNGMVYMSYFHSWNSYSHNLVDACHAMSRIFGNDPPVYARPPGSTIPTTSPSPPSYSDIQSSASLAASTTPTSTQPSASSSTSGGLSTEERRRLAELEREAAEANAAVEAARRADKKEEEDRQLVYRLKNDIVESTNETLQAHLDVSKVQIQEYLTDQMVLEKCNRYITGDISDVASGQTVYLTKQKEELQRCLKDIQKSIDEMEVFIRKAEKNKEDQEESISVDDLALPEDIHSAQMVCFSAENAAITDALYFLDKGLVDQRIDVETHLRAVRKLARKQFLTRAHLLKVGQVKISQSFREKSTRSLTK